MTNHWQVVAIVYIVSNNEILDLPNVHTYPNSKAPYGIIVDPLAAPHALPGDAFMPKPLRTKYTASLEPSKRTSDKAAKYLLSWDIWDENMMRGIA